MLWASFFDPHNPYLIPEPWASMYKPEDMDIPETVNDDISDMPLHYRVTRGRESGQIYLGRRQPSYPVHGIAQHRWTKRKLQQNKAIYYGMVSMMDHYIGKNTGPSGRKRTNRQYFNHIHHRSWGIYRTSRFGR